MNWRYNERTQGPTANFANILYILFMILINFSFSANNKKIDSYGHLGGLITGFFLLFIIAKPNGNDHLCCSINIWKITDFSLIKQYNLNFTNIIKQCS